MKTKSLLMLAIIAISLFFTVGCKKTETWKPKPPFPGLEVPVKVFSINSEKDTLISLPGGTSIFIEKGIFVNYEGQPETGNIDLHYREFHDALDVYLSGIHMDFYSMGEKRTFQTAGMFEINASKNSIPLALAPGKKIDITFGSKYPGSEYTFFFLNPASGEWEWVDNPGFQINDEKVKAQQNLAAKMPKLFMGDQYFILNYKWLLDIYLNNDWDKIYKLLNDKGIRRKLEAYRVKFNDVYSGGELVFGRSYYAPGEMLWKDLDGKSFPRWLKDFDTQWEKDANGNWYISNYLFKSMGNNIYEITYKSGKRVFSKKMEAVLPLKNLLKLPAEEWQKRYDEAMKELAEEQSKIDLMAETFRSFSINQLGVFNFDVLLKLDDWIEIVPEFTISNAPADAGDVIIIFGDNTGYITLKPENLTKMRINPPSNHRILMVLPENKLGVFPVEKLKDVDIEALKAQVKPEFTFDLEQHSITDAVALREFLGFK